MKNENGAGIFLDESFLLEIMPEIDAEYIKIYIMARYLSAKNGGMTDVQTVCDALGADRGEVGEALRVLADKKAVNLGADETIRFENGEMYTSVSIKKTAVEEPNSRLADMLEVAQKILGKMLSAPSVMRLYDMYDEGMSTELILRLLEYCAELGKKDMRYIEKVALSWREMGIETVAQAEKYINEQSYKKSYEYKIRSSFGIGDRALAASEKKYISAWGELGISVELAEFAYDYCVSKTGKFAMAYINRVLTAWNEMGIKTPETARAEIERYSAEYSRARGAKSTKKAEVYNSGRYDYDEIDKLAREKLKNRIGKK